MIDLSFSATIPGWVIAVLIMMIASAVLAIAVRDPERSFMVDFIMNFVSIAGMTAITVIIIMELFK